ncbi:MAG: acyl-CoA dehydrogenase family protein [Candidatus Zambryskibacteria bacterium]|nr:acyl-CoA dehydrogenase family protein [Candidatus Zambryskibacteria bacterium]
MGHYHSGEGQHIEQSVKEFCENEIRKNLGKFVKDKSFPRDVFRKMGELGFLGAMIPEAYGGVGMSMREYVILMESLACYGGGSIALTLTAHHSLAAAHIVHAGTEEQKITFLPKLASGEMIGAWCLTEPEAGSDAFGKGMKTIATLNNHCWNISGSKQFITNGSIADIYVVITKIGSDEKNYGAFIVPKYWGKIIQHKKGFIQHRPETNKIGMHASDTSAVIFDGVELSVEAKMEGDGKKSTYKVLNNGRVGISALACGLMRSALSEAVSYARERKSFGKAIANYQGVSFPLADASSELDASWAMVEKAALAADQGKLTIELAAKTKLKTTKSALEGCLTALQVFGGLGYMMETRVAQDFTDALLLKIGEGTDNMQRLAIAKSLFSL